MKIAYFDCNSGAGGDMIVAAMLDAGLDGGYLRRQVATLGIEGLEINISETKRGGLRGLRFEPKAAEQAHHRHLKEIVELINNSGISPAVKQKAIAVFRRLAEAEAAVHGEEPDDIHFHEIGAVDSICDIVSACVGLEALGIEKVYCSPLSVGGGVVKCEHGLLPVPAPATAELIKGIPIKAGPANVELLTPTAAAIFATVACGFGAVPEMKIEKCGYGAGARELAEIPNLLRVIIGDAAESDSAETDSVCLIEANIDDASGELIGAAMDELLARGALDAYCTPLIMKHNRPAVKLSVLCEPKDAGKFEKFLFEQNLTFGLREQIVQRRKLAREIVTVQTEFGQIRVKIGRLAEKITAVKPEFADCVKAAGQFDVAIKKVLDAAMQAFRIDEKSK